MRAAEKDILSKLRKDKYFSMQKKLTKICMCGEKMTNMRYVDAHRCASAKIGAWPSLVLIQMMNANRYHDHFPDMLPDKQGSWGGPTERTAWPDLPT